MGITGVGGRCGIDRGINDGVLASFIEYYFMSGIINAVYIVIEVARSIIIAVIKIMLSAYLSPALRLYLSTAEVKSLLAQ